MSIRLCPPSAILLFGFACGPGAPEPNEGEISTSIAAGCTPGVVETRNRGRASRVCTSRGAWTAWALCPISPITGAPLHPPYRDPVVFFSPHPDDETIGMAGAIRSHVEAGDDVYLELMTRGGESRACGSLDFTACGDARVREFMDAAVRLGVTGVALNDFDVDSRTGARQTLSPSQVHARIQFWKYAVTDGLRLRGPAGDEDPTPRYSTTTEGATHPDHALVHEALMTSSVAGVKSYLVYHFGHYDQSSEIRCRVAGSDAVGPCPPSTFHEVEDIGAVCAIKRAAIAAYRVYDPSNGRFAIGGNSVPELMAGSAEDCHEYVRY